MDASSAFSRRDQGYYLLHEAGEALADLVVGEVGPAEFYVGDVVGGLVVEVLELAGYGLGAAYYEVYGVGAEVFRIGGFLGFCGDFAFLLESAPEGSQGGFGFVPGGLVVVAYVEGAVGGDLAVAACGLVGGAVLVVLLRGSEVGEEDVEVEVSGDFGGADAVDGDEGA